MSETHAPSGENYKIEALSLDRDQWRNKVFRLDDRVRELETEIQNIKSQRLYCTKCGAELKVGFR